MNISEFNWLFQQTNRHLNMSEEEFLSLREEFKKEQEKNRKRDLVLQAIFPDKIVSEFKEQLEKSESDSLSYNVIVVSKNENYQVEIYHKEKLCSVNAGYGNDFFSKEEAEQLTFFLQKHCCIGSVSYEEAAPIFLFSKTIVSHLFYTLISKIRLEQIQLSEAEIQQFQEIILAQLSDEKKKEMAFFELSLDTEKMIEKNKLFFLLTQQLNKNIKVSQKEVNEKDGTIYIKIEEINEREELPYEYC